VSRSVGLGRSVSRSLPSVGALVGLSVDATFEVGGVGNVASVMMSRCESVESAWPVVLSVGAAGTCRWMHV